jgi:ESS family glutamate:Na+ symporter
VTTYDLDLLTTLVVATALYFLGHFLVRRVPVLASYSIPVPVVGGVLFAIGLALAGLVFKVQVAVDPSPKDPLLLAFFATLGLGADVRSLARGGRKLVVLLLLFVLLMLMQDAIGIALARLLDLHPLVGLLAGSISLVGGHGTAAAYAQNFTDVRNLQGALELGMAAATAGLVLGSVLAGPVAERLMARAAPPKSAGGDAPAPATPAPENPVFLPITSEQLLFVLMVCLVCIGAAGLVHGWMRGSGILLPDFLWALLVGMAVRNGATLAGIEGINDRAVQAVGSVSLSLFLVIALMGLRILDLASLAGPLLVIIAANAVATAAFAYFITSRAMGGGYDGAVVGAGQVAAGLATTAVAMSVMQTITERHGPSPLAFLLVPIVGAFFADIANAAVLQLYFALPMLGF